MTEELKQAEKPEFGIKDLFKIRNYLWLWLGQIVSNFGDSLTRLALVLYINDVTDGSTSAIAYLLIVMTIPQATVGLLAGVFVDRFDRKNIMLLSDVLRGVLVFGFIFAILQGGADILWLIYTIAFLHATISAFFTPARSAIIPNLIPTEGLLAANSLSQISLVLFNVIGTAAAGFLVGSYDAYTMVFVVDALTFFVSLFFISRIVLPAGLPKPEVKSNSARAVFAEMAEGAKIAFSSRPLVGTLVGAGVTMLGLGAVNVLMAPFVVNDLQLNETWFGAIELAQTIAMILSASLVAALASRIKATNIISSGLMLLGICISLFMFADNIWQLFPILFAIGLVVSPINAGIATLVQTEVADEARGRISAALGSVLQTASLASMFAAGTVAAWLGIRTVFLIGGIITIIAGIGAAIVFRGYEPPAPIEIEAEPDAEAVALG